MIHLPFHSINKLYLSLWRSQGLSEKFQKEWILLDSILCGLLGSRTLPAFHLRGVLMLFGEATKRKDLAQKEQEGLLLFLATLYTQLEMGSIYVKGTDLVDILKEHLSQASSLLQEQLQSTSPEQSNFLKKLVQDLSSEDVATYINSRTKAFLNGQEKELFQHIVVFETKYKEWKEKKDIHNAYHIPPIIKTADGSFFFSRLYQSKQVLSQFLEERLLSNSSLTRKRSTTVLTEKEILKGDPTLVPEQVLAVQKACSSSFTLITGGPGTGKTTVVASILKAFLQIHSSNVTEIEKQEFAKNILLGAPTGRAAARLKEALFEKWGSQDTDFANNISSSTLHRMLQYNPHNKSFVHSKKVPLQAKLICIDEVSMIDIDLFASFLQAVPPDCTLILIGDPHQLPSVQPGAVLGDLTFKNSEKQSPPSVLLEALKKHTAGLKICHRSEQGILQVSEAIQSGKGERALENIHCLNVSAQKWKEEVSSLLETVFQKKSTNLDTTLNCTLIPIEERSILEYAEIWAKQCYLNPLPSLANKQTKKSLSYHLIFQKLEQSLVDTFKKEESHSLQEVSIEKNPNLYSLFFDLFHILNSTRCLCTLKEGSRGLQQVNQAITHYLRPHFENADNRSDTFCFSGMPIILQKNIHSLKLYNGDTGVLTNIQGNSVVWFFMEQTPNSPKRFIAYPTHSLTESPAHLQPAYATTVHKAQGSEYQHISLILAHQKHPLLTREILYTGLTRAKYSSQIVGSPQEFLVGTRNCIKRESGVL